MNRQQAGPGPATSYVERGKKWETLPSSHKTPKFPPSCPCDEDHKTNLPVPELPECAVVSAGQAEKEKVGII